MEHEKVHERAIERVYDDIEKVLKKPELSPADYKALTDAYCLLEKIDNIQNGYMDEDEGYSESYGHGGSYRRGRNHMNGRFMSMNSRHSVTDRAIAELEQMDTYSDYERKILSDLIKKIESN